MTRSANLASFGRTIDAAPLSLDASGNLGVGTSSTSSKVYITTASTTAYGFISQTPVVGLTTGNYVNMAYFTNTRSTNNDGLRIVNLRDSTGSGVGNWETESYRIRRSVDQNDGSSGVQEEIIFGQNILAFSTAGSERMRISSSGYVTIPYQPYARVNVAAGTTNLSLTGGTTTVIPFNNVVDQIGSNYNTSTYRFTAPVAGLYMVSAAVEGSSITSNWVNLFLRINGSNFAGTYYTGRNVAYDKIQTDGIIKCNAGDYIDVAITVNQTGGNLELPPGDTRNILFIALLH